AQREAFAPFLTQHEPPCRRKSCQGRYPAWPRSCSEVLIAIQDGQSFAGINSFSGDLHTIFEVGAVMQPESGGCVGQHYIAIGALAAVQKLLQRFGVVSRVAALDKIGHDKAKPEIRRVEHALCQLAFIKDY